MNASRSCWKNRRRLVASTAIAAVLLAGGPLVMNDLGWDPFGSPAHAKCCFTAETIVLLHDGTPREIHRIEVGDVVLGQAGAQNTVIGIECVRLGDRKLFGINGSTPFFTEEHPFLTSSGWRSVNPVSSFAETPSLHVEPLCTGDELVGMDMGPIIAGATALAPLVRQLTVRLIRLASVTSAADTKLFNLLLDGDHTYVANGFVVHNKGGESGGGEGGDSDGGGEGGDSDGGGEGGDSDGGGEGGDSDGGGEGGDSDGGGEGGDSDDGGEGGESGDDDRNDASSNDDGGESGRGRGRGRGGDDDHDDASSDDDGGEGGGGRDHRGSGGERGFDGSSEPAGSDLTPDEERELISRGWE